MSSAGAVEVFNATFWGNSALAGGGIEDDATVAGVQGFVLLNGTLLESEASGGNCSGFISDNGYNIADDESCELGSTSVMVNPATAWSRHCRIMAGRRRLSLSPLSAMRRVLFQ